MPKSEIRFLATYLFGDEQGRNAAKRVDRQIDRLPGLNGLHLLDSAIAEALAEGLREVRPTYSEREKVAAAS